MGQKLYQQVLSKFVNTHDATFPTLWTKMCSYDCFDVSCKCNSYEEKSWFDIVINIQVLRAILTFFYYRLP